MKISAAFSGKDYRLIEYGLVRLCCWASVLTGLHSGLSVQTLSYLAWVEGYVAPSAYFVQNQVFSGRS